MSSSKDHESGAFAGINYRTTIGTAVAAAVGAGPGVALAQQGEGLEEIVVTATKRGDVSVMDIAGSIQAFDTDAIRDQGLTDMETYTKLTPNLTYFSAATGQGKIYIRGIADDPNAFIANSSAAIYLDEQPVTQSNAVDVRLVDIERVEVLAGPQGTLFGSSSQSGTLRIVTNKPDPTAFEAFADATVKGMSEGDNSFDISGMVNIPLVEDTFALRLVGFSATEGGYIDNVLGTTANCEAYAKCEVDGPASNEDAVEDDWNETSITGGRVAAQWNMSENWASTLSAIFQSVESDAENQYDPTVGDLELIQFYPNTWDDDWEQYALTFEGTIGENLTFTSATAFFTRDSFYQQDNSEYSAAFGFYCTYYSVLYNRYCFQPAGAYYWYNDPIGFRTQDTKNEMFSQEFRLAFTGDTVDWVVGAFYEDRIEEWDFNTSQFNQGGYRASQGFDSWVRPHEIIRSPAYYYNASCYDFDGAGSSYYCSVNGWGVPATATDTWWFSADETDWETYAVFGELTWRINDQWAVTGGARWFDVESSKQYTVQLPLGRTTPAIEDLSGNGVLTEGCLVSDAPCNTYDTDNPDDIGVNFIDGSDDDIAVKFSLQWTPTEDLMFYGLYSEGFRPGGVNRNRGVPALPQVYTADFLENTEFGMKGTFASGRVQVSAVAFFQDWVDYQLEVVDPSQETCETRMEEPCGQPWQKGIVNAGEAHSDGFDVTIDTLLTDQFRLTLSAVWLESELDTAVEGIDDVGPGSPLPFAPDFKASVLAQYNWPMRVGSSDEAFIQFQYSHTGDSLNQVQEIEGGGTPQLEQEAYDWMSLRFGVKGSSWEANIFVNNLTDERGQLYQDVFDSHPLFDRSRVSVVRPREYGLRFIKYWGG